MNPIALVVDSGTDVVSAYVPDVKLYKIPLLVNYADHTYRDGIDIDSAEVERRLAIEIPKTSLPTLGELTETFKTVLADGFTQAVVVTISSGLSGTHEAMRLAAQQVPELECVFIDTKSIGLGAGVSAIAAGRLIAGGTSFEHLEERILARVRDSKVFFCLETLEYLKAGGRIGEVVYLLGSVLNIKPIISCNDKGTYSVVSTARGRIPSIKKLVKHARDVAEHFSSYNVGIMHTGAKDDAEKVLAHVKEHFPRAKQVFRGVISPALIVHTGPGLLGIVVQGLDA